MFGHLKKYRVILVTGPHRSGTTIAARMIAADTGHDFVIEDEIGFAKIEWLAAFIHSQYGPLVIQCPFLCNNIHQLKAACDIDYAETCVVMMHRFRKDIEASEEKAKRVNFVALGEKQKRAIGDRSALHVSDVKYDHWEHQRRLIPNVLDLGYTSLSDHPMWVEDRSQFRFQHGVVHPRISIPQGFRDGLLAI
jgi:hypothetical protein